MLQDNKTLVLNTRIIVRAIPKGSMIGFRRGRGCSVRYSNANNLKKYTNTITNYLKQQKKQEKIVRLQNAVHAEYEYYFTRPRTHYKKNGELNREGERHPYPIKKSNGDIDKLDRAVNDCITASGLWNDDSQLVSSSSIKMFTQHEHDDAFIIIRLYELF